MAHEDGNRLRAQRAHSTSCCYDSIKSLRVEGHRRWQIPCQAPDAARPRRQSFHHYRPRNMVIGSKLQPRDCLGAGWLRVCENPILACSLVGCEWKALINRTRWEEWELCCKKQNRCERKKNRTDLIQKGQLRLCVNDKGRATWEEDEGDNEALTLCVASQQSSTHDRAHAHACVSVATFVRPFFPPISIMFSPLVPFFPFFVLSGAHFHSQDVSSGPAQCDTCASPAVFPRVVPVYSLAMRACQRMIAIKSEQRCPGWACPLDYKMVTSIWKEKKIHIMLCCVFYKGKIWNIQISYPDPETVMGRTSGDQKTVMSYSSLCMFSSTFSLSLSHLLPLTISLKTLDRQFPRSWVVWG